MNEKNMPVKEKVKSFENAPKARFNTHAAMVAARRRGVRALLIASTLALAIVFSAYAFFGHEKARIETNARISTALYAKVIEDQTTRVFGNSELITGLLADYIKRQPDLPSAQALDVILSSSTTDQPYIRGIALVNTDGQIIATSLDTDRNGILHWRTLGGYPTDSDSRRLMPLQRGAGLVDLGKETPVRQAPMVLPLVQPIFRSDSNVLFLVTLINLDYLSEQIDRLIDDPKTHVALSRYSGELLLKSLRIKVSPGSRLDKLPVFEKLLMKRNADNFTGVGLFSESVVGAYRVFKNLPLVTLVEQTRESLSSEVTLKGFTIAAVAFAALLLVAGTTLLVRRRARRDEAMTLELKAAYDQALAMEARKKAVLQASLDAVFSTDGQAKIVDMNPAAERMFGHTLERVNDQCLDELIIPEDVRGHLKQNLAHFLAVSNSKALNQFRTINAVRRDGTLFPIEYAIARVKMLEDTVYIVTIRDISERQAAERVLRDSELRWKLALEVSGEGVWDWDISKNTFIYSSKWLGMLGYSREELPQKQSPWDQLIHPDDADNFSAAMHAHLFGKSSAVEVECRMRCKDGAWKWIHSRGMVVTRSERSGRPYRFVGTHTDISYRMTTNSKGEEQGAVLAVGEYASDALEVRI